MAYQVRDNLPAVHPGEILRDELDVLGLNARKFAAHIGVPPNAITEILNGNRKINAEMAMRLGQAFQTDEQYWLNLQSHYDAKIARMSMGEKIKDIEPLVAAPSVLGLRDSNFER